MTGIDGSAGAAARAAAAGVTVLLAHRLRLPKGAHP